VLIRYQHLYLTTLVALSVITVTTVTMLASRSMKPKLSLSISTNIAQTSRPSLPVLSPVSKPMCSPLSPSPSSPTARNTRLNQRGYSTLQKPTYAYSNSSSCRSILKKGQPSSAVSQRKLQFSEQPVVYKVAPIEEEDYYGAYKKMTRDERRWRG